jgi:hypothetical protein
MQLARPAIAIDPRCFGRGRRLIDAPPSEPLLPALSAELRLFATTFLAGFVFVFVFLA